MELNYFGDTAGGQPVFGEGGPSPFDLARAGIDLRESGNLDDAETVFEQLMQTYPAVPFGWQEMGVLQVKRGDALKAMGYFKRAVEIEPNDILTLCHFAIHLQEMGRTDEAHTALDAFKPTSQRDKVKVAAMRDFLSYLDAFPKWDGVDLANEIEHSPSFINVRLVEDRIWAAINERKPFSLIRLGDGEGAWIDMGPDDDQAFAGLYAMNRSDILKLWFGNDSLLDDALFNAMRATFMSAIHNADLIGFPYSLRMVMEYDSKSVRGAPSCNNIIRWAAEQLGHNDVEFCSNDMHIELHDAGFFKKLFASPTPIGIITCHAQLPYKLASDAGANVVQAELIPEEKGFSKVIGQNGMDEAHFPSVFRRVMQNLGEHSQQGVVWLIAAGYLGKLYCGKVREMGGVALDVGSLSDGWIGKITRPTLADRQRFSI